MNVSTYRPPVITLKDDAGDFILKYEGETERLTGITYSFVDKAELITSLEDFIEEVRKA